MKPDDILTKVKKILQSLCIFFLNPSGPYVHFGLNQVCHSC